MDTRSNAYIRPGFFLARIVNPINRWLGLSPLLIVPGRRSGAPRSVPIGRPFEHSGARYLVAGRGETHWVRNLRAAGLGELRIRGAAERFRAVEVEGIERDRIIAAYREKLGRAVNGYFEQIPDPAGHPVFRIEPIASGETPS